jgi:hypothetical protein
MAKKNASPLGPYFAIGKGVTEAVTGLPRCKGKEYDRGKVLDVLMDEDTRDIHITLLMYVAEVCKRIRKRKKADHTRHERVMKVFKFMDEHRDWLMLGPKQQDKKDLLDFRLGVLEVAKQRYLKNRK